MSSITVRATIQLFRRAIGVSSLTSFTLIFISLLVLSLSAVAQGPVSGSFVGKVTDDADLPIAGAIVTFKNQTTGFQAAARTDQNGQFSRTALPPGVYEIEARADNYSTERQIQNLYATRPNVTLPNPFRLRRTTVAATQTPTPTSSATPDPNRTPNPNPSPVTTTTPVSTGTISNRSNDVVSDIDETANLNPRRDGAFDEKSVRGLPLGSSTLTRTFDELAFLVPGVMLPPQAIGNSVGPGVGGGVGTSGQFSVNGLRSRANNFTVDGSDNNDEDIGVRRQGFFTLVPQPIESIQEFQIITLLAPAQYGRNLGAQVNALSKSGGNAFHGSLFTFFNSEKFNARNTFDRASGNYSSLLTTGASTPVLFDGAQRTVTNTAGDKDPFNLFQGGAALGGRLVRDKLFFFVSGEGQVLNATQERHFAVPTIEQRAVFNSPGGLQQCQPAAQLGFGQSTVINGQCFFFDGATLFPFPFSPGYPTSTGGDAVFSLIPFANDPSGIYGRNTYTQALSTDARGRIFSGKIDWNIFRIRGNQQTFTARYNYTDDKRDLTDVGGALFSAIRPLVRTDNFSSYLSGSLTDNISNELRVSYGRTRLRFEELPDATGFLRPVSSSIITNAADRRFLLNAPVLFNVTLPTCNSFGCTSAAQTRYSTTNLFTQNFQLGPIGQLNIAGFSPIGVDVFNFPQERKNNTYQIADTVRWQLGGGHGVSFGTDIRRTVLDSNLPRNSRPLVTFGGSCFNGASTTCNTTFASPLNLAAAGAATGFFQSLVLPNNNSEISLSYYQLNSFGQDEWRVRPNLTISYGLRYEYNTVPKEADQKIESTFNIQQSQFPTVPGANLFKGFSDLIAGRTQIYDPDRNNFAPRVGFAWAPVSKTVIRGGYGIYYDQIIGAVVSQSRNVFPTFTTANTGGGDLSCNDYFALLNPINTPFNPNNCSANSTIVAPGTLNTLNPAFSRLDMIRGLFLFPIENGTSFGATLPSRKLDTPMSHQYSIGVEQKIFRDTFLSVAYVGTMGRSLLRFTTPNLGSNYLIQVSGFDLINGQPQVFGSTFDPFSNAQTLDRPNPNIGPINQFETTGRSRYDSLQIEMRGRITNNFQYRTSYVYGKVKDDVSDVFDLAGAWALPQNSRTFAGEYAPANFDVRHRFTYSFMYDLPKFKDSGSAVRLLFGDWTISGTGKYNTGQPFTVTSIYDINLDGNLTDRLNNTQFITETGNRSQPLVVSSNANRLAMLAPIGQDGAIPRNSFRAGSILDLDMTVAKRFFITESQNIQFRVDIFNFINRANYGIPVRFLEAPGFGQATDTVTPGRRIQFALKYNF